MFYQMILVAIGANLPSRNGADPINTCAWAADCLAALPDTRLVARSRWFQSAAWPPSTQPDYVNGVVHLAGHAEPRALLATLHAIEAEAGRVRGVANAARTLDLDLLAMDGIVLDTPSITLPHPRMAERAFVLAPLCDVLPQWRHPLLNRISAELLAGLADAGAAKPLP